MEFQRMGLGWTVLLLFAFVGGVLTTITRTTKQVVLHSKADCATSLHMIGKNYSAYNVEMQWDRENFENCSKHERGLSCRQTFIQENNFSNLGMRLCIDVQGVQRDIKRMTQLYVTVDDRDGDLKRIYSSTRLRPEEDPYYVCTSLDQNAISVSINVRPSVSICPSILDYLVNNRIRLGTVVQRPLSSIATVDLEECSAGYIPRDNSYLIKVNAAGARDYCHVTRKLPLPYSYMRGCLTVAYFSKDFDCEITVWLHSENNGGYEIAIPLDRSPGSDNQRCETFSSRNGLPVLSFKLYPYRYSRTCKGQFALSLDFRQTPPPDRVDDDDDDARSPNLYMAVFITLIAICLVCLGLTCLCCVRFRAKRLRRLQRRNHRRQASTQNQGFQYDMSTAPPYDTDVPWTPPEPGMLFRLPSYDDVVAESSGGINPSADPNKNDLPPAYDSVCSTTET